MNSTYRFKKDDPLYEEKRRKHLVELTKNRYKNDETFREACKTRARVYYQKLKSQAMTKETVENP
jgi:hypothetical protein